MKSGDEKERAGKEAPETTPAEVSGAALGYLNRRLVKGGIAGRRGKWRTSKRRGRHLRTLLGIVGVTNGWSGTEHDGYEGVKGGLQRDSSQ